MPQGQQSALQGYRDVVCSGQATARTQRFSGLAAELRNQLDVAKVAQQVSMSAAWLEDMPALLGASWT